MAAAAALCPMLAAVSTSDMARNRNAGPQQPRRRTPEET